ncbi:MAG: hypothetical protein D6743_13285 [Calditrichaeota bacterium]|nr:MAG: hypothetical protein D6743_13285 [Calditrichota bacterium]
MKNCDLYSELCSRYLEQDLPAHERTELEAHLETCPTCRATLEELRYLRQRLKNLQPISTSPHFETVLRARIQMSKHIGRRSLWAWPEFRRWPVLGFAAAALVLALVFLLQYQPANHWLQRLNPAQSVVSSAQASQNPIYYSLELVPIPQNVAPVHGRSGGLMPGAAQTPAALSETPVDSSGLRGEAREKFKRHIRAVSF